MTNNEVLNLKLNPETDPYLSYDQMRISHTIVFPTVTLELLDTEPLNRVADEIRMANGHLPCYGNIEKWGVQELDTDGIYRFFVTLYGVLPGCENCIVAHYVGGHGEIEEFEIPLTDSQRALLFATLNTHCEYEFDESVIDMMAEYANEVGLNWNGMMPE